MNTIENNITSTEPKVFFGKLNEAINKKVSFKLALILVTLINKSKTKDEVSSDIESILKNIGIERTAIKINRKSIYIDFETVKIPADCRITIKPGDVRLGITLKK